MASHRGGRARNPILASTCAASRPRARRSPPDSGGRSPPPAAAAGASATDPAWFVPAAGDAILDLGSSGLPAGDGAHRLVHEDHSERRNRPRTQITIVSPVLIPVKPL